MSPSRHGIPSGACVPRKLLDWARFSVPAPTGLDNSDTVCQVLAGGSLASFRLAFPDYYRFYSQLEMPLLLMNQAIFLDNITQVRVSTPVPRECEFTLCSQPANDQRDFF
jgi:hypothetical protein